MKVSLYDIDERIPEFLAELLSISEEDVRQMNDDRIERSLKGLFDAGRSSLMTEIIVRAVKEFDLSMERLNNDSTSVALSGIYRTETGKDMRMKKNVSLEDEISVQN